MCETIINEIYKQTIVAILDTNIAPHRETPGVLEITAKCSLIDSPSRVLCKEVQK